LFSKLDLGTEEDERYGICRVRGMGLPGPGVGHDLEIAMVSSDKHPGTRFLGRADHAPKTFVENLDGLDRS
jgi:hypothetical protein